MLIAHKTILIALALLITLTYVSLTNAIPTPQDPATEATITLDIDGTDYSGLDSGSNNGQVSNIK